ncbi:CUN039 hypothetical protein [Culex nigripalpus nucleopolyhedrovirus]|uniref:Ig-like domain-containing protein n=1 Tax=Culex nigripalpus nucleopolyhedrovirus (isolate Florida/1997) TaxID=645993 RepID=Q919N0_NPVCO|nr:CUN039 hypothetical protein [Culex nigripalpus nucleopolyhedrovirus]AAK94117.1 CUN039 hypothetical protein [Culex nigripalpus nucleopolyhedrovirus]
MLLQLLFMFAPLEALAFDKPHVAVVESPPETVYINGSVKLPYIECTFLSKPPAHMSWVSERQREWRKFRYLDQGGSTSRESIAIMVSRMLLPEYCDGCPDTGNIYRCEITSPGHDLSAHSYPTRVHCKDWSEKWCTDFLHAKIVLFYKSIFSPIGSTVRLPCRVAGRVTKYAYRWSRAEDAWPHDIASLDERDGTLTLTAINWSHLGVYVCELVGESGVLLDRVETFLYPVQVTSAQA